MLEKLEDCPVCKAGLTKEEYEFQYCKCGWDSMAVQQDTPKGFTAPFCPVFKFAPTQKVRIIPFDTEGRINRCVADNGNLLIYYVSYYLDCKQHYTEFYEDELEAIG